MTEWIEQRGIYPTDYILELCQKSTIMTFLCTTICKHLPASGKSERMRVPSKETHVRTLLSGRVIKHWRMWSQSNKEECRERQEKTSSNAKDYKPSCSLWDYMEEDRADSGTMVRQRKKCRQGQRAMTYKLVSPRPADVCCQPGEWGFWDQLVSHA